MIIILFKKLILKLNLIVATRLVLKDIDKIKNEI